PGPVNRSTRPGDPPNQPPPESGFASMSSSTAKPAGKGSAPVSRPVALTTPYLCWRVSRLVPAAGNWCRPESGSRLAVGHPEGLALTPTRTAPGLVAGIGCVRAGQVWLSQRLSLMAWVALPPASLLLSDC